MSKPFDATAAGVNRAGTGRLAGVSRNPGAGSGSGQVIDSNLSTVTAEADKVLWVEERVPLDPARRDPGEPRRTVE